MICGKKLRISDSERIIKIDNEQVKRYEFESKNLGMFERVFPASEEEKKLFKEPYEKYIDVSRQYYHKFTGLNKREKNLSTGF